MSSTRALLLALFATIAIATCQLPGEAVVEESVEPFEEEFMQAPIDETLTHKMNGAQVIADSEAVATAGPSDAHDEITCASGEVMCADGTCAIECPSVNPDAKPGFKYEFQPNPTQLAAPPNVAGRQADYQAMASNFHDSQISGEQQAIVNAEQSAGLGFASHDSALQEHEQRLAAKKQEVEKDMNLAAAQAAHFKEETKAHDEAALNVKKSQEEEAAQERVVEEAKKTLEAEEKKLREAKLYVSKMIQIEEDARYKAEYSGQLYEAAKAKAIGEDNALQEELHETAQKEHYRQVALKAVKEAAARDLARTKEEALIHHAKKAAIGVPTGSAAGSAKSPKKCSDCTSLPHIYVEAGGKCADCSKWAAKGECKQAEYKKFMTHYCAESCGCPETTEVPETTEMQMPQQDEDEEY
jgi:hypothetical protein